MSLDTDLPDFTVVMVSVSRSYFKKGNTTAYPIDYFQEKGTVGQWRKARSIALDEAKWDRDFKSQQRKTAQAGIGGDVGRISRSVDVHFVVPINQADDRFGSSNQNLVGRAVVRNGTMRNVRAAAVVQKPIGSVSKAPQGLAGYDNLAVGRSYRVQKEVPLMPELNPKDPLVAVSRSRRIPPGSVISVQEIGKKDGDRWYRVVATVGGKNLGGGWLNSIALMGQALEIVK